MVPGVAVPSGLKESRLVDPILTGSVPNSVEMPMTTPGNNSDRRVGHAERPIHLRGDIERAHAVMVVVQEHLKHHVVAVAGKPKRDMC